DDARPRQLLQVKARLAELDTKALHRADREALADEVVQTHAADDDLPARLGARQPDLLERLRLDQRQRSARPLAVGAEVPVALEPAARDRAHEVDRREPVRGTDVDRFDHRLQATRTCGDSSLSEATTASASAVAAPGGKCAFGIATQRMPAALAERMPLWESSIAVQSCGSTPRRRATCR